MQKARSERGLRDERESGSGALARSLSRNVVFFRRSASSGIWVARCVLQRKGAASEKNRGYVVDK